MLQCKINKTNLFMWNERKESGCRWLIVSNLWHRTKMEESKQQFSFEYSTVRSILNRMESDIIHWEWSMLVKMVFLLLNIDESLSMLIVPSVFIPASVTCKWNLIVYQTISCSMTCLYEWCNEGAFLTLN